MALALDDKIFPPAHMGTADRNLIETVPKIFIGECDDPPDFTARQIAMALEFAARDWLTSRDVVPV